jgi:hypothetical protein
VFCVVASNDKDERAKGVFSSTLWEPLKGTHVAVARYGGLRILFSLLKVEKHMYGTCRVAPLVELTALLKSHDGLVREAHRATGVWGVYQYSRADQ